MLTLFCRSYCQAQFFKKIYRNDFDSSYISSHSGEIVIGPFISSNSIDYNIGDDDYNDYLVYRPNGRYNWGVSIGYKFFSLDIGFKLPTADDNPGKYGNTDRFRIGWSDYSRKLVFDIFAQFYKGYYLSNSNLIKGHTTTSPYYIRPDIATAQLGTSLMYILNYRRFSYKAAFGQSEYQKKSAGSALLGIVFNYNVSQGDSAIIPSNLVYTDYWNKSDFHRSTNTCLSIDGGYAHNFIIKKHIFVAAKAVAGVGLTATRLYGSFDSKGYGLLIHTAFRFSLGYNSERYMGSISFNQLTSHDTFPIDYTWLEYSNNSFVVTFITRLKPPKLKLFNISL